MTKGESGPSQLDAEQTFVVCRLIPLDKNPEVHPIGIREVTKQIVGKCIS